MLGKGFVMANGDSTRLSDVIKVEAVPAYNTTPGHTQFHPKGRDNGYILPGKTAALTTSREKTERKTS